MWHTFVLIVFNVDTTVVGMKDAMSLVLFHKVVCSFFTVKTFYFLILFTIMDDTDASTITAGHLSQVV